MTTTAEEGEEEGEAGGVRCLHRPTEEELLCQVGGLRLGCFSRPRADDWRDERIGRKMMILSPPMGRRGQQKRQRKNDIGHGNDHVTTNWSLKRDEDEGFHPLDSPAASFRFVFRAGAEARPNERQKTLAWRLKIFKIGKTRSVILFDTLFQVIERGNIVRVK